MLGAVYDIEPAPRTAADVIAPEGSDRERTPGPKAAGKWLTGSVTDNTQTVISAVFDQPEQRGPDHQRTWIVLVDGARAQIEQIQTEAALRGARIHIVCDFIHVLEYLWKAAWCFHENGDPGAERFVGRHATTVLAHGPDRVWSPHGFHHTESGEDGSAAYSTLLADVNSCTDTPVGGRATGPGAFVGWASGPAIFRRRRR
jgi:hypothetical protein